MLLRMCLSLLGLCGLALLLALSPLPELVSAIFFGLVALVWLGYFGWSVVDSFFRPGRVFREVCRELGLQSSSRYMIFGVSCSGVIEGRRASARFAPARAPMPSIMEMFLEAPLPFRIAIARGRPMLDCRGCPRLKPLDPFLAGFHIRSDGPPSTVHFLEGPTVRGQLLAILSEGARELYLQPARIWFRCSPRMLSVESLKARLDPLLELARSAEKELPCLPAPNASKPR